METIDRRHFLAITAGVIPLGYRPPGTLEPRGPTERQPQTPQETAELLSEWELAANKSNWRDRWHLMNYTGMIAWGPGIAALFGVGTVDQAEEDFAGVCRWLRGDGNRFSVRVLATAQTPCKRSWAVVVDGLAPAGQGVNRLRAPWKVGCASALREFERAIGRPRLRTIML